MANHHFGEIGDVWKHLVLAEVLSQARPRGYWETHAGSASYPLTRTWQKEYGVHRFLERAPSEPLLADSAYHALVSAQSGRYPGSAALALRILGGDASYLLCDEDPESVRSLQAAFTGRRARVVHTEGITAVVEAAREVESARDDLLIHIDPFDPYLASGRSGMCAFDLAVALANGGFPVAYWYGVETPEQRGWAARSWVPQLKRKGARVWFGELSLAALERGPVEANPGVRGCGMVLANLPPPLEARCAALGEALARLYADAKLPTREPGALAFSASAHGNAPCDDHADDDAHPGD